jgi:uncharacterized protein (DUF1778 family)
MTGRVARTQKLDLRLTPAAKHKLRVAADAARRSVSDFVLDSALARADEVLVEHGKLGLTREQWVAFSKALDEKPRSHVRMKNLLHEPSVFDRR